MNDNLICEPENHPELRYLLAKKGTNNLLVIGLHPGEVHANTSDPFIRSIDSIAENNGYDGWLLVNLYPRRKTLTADLELTEEKEIFWYNINLIKFLLDRKQFKIKDVFLAWGDDIEIRPYLIQAAGYLYKGLLSQDLNYLSIGRSRKANPRHPSALEGYSSAESSKEVELFKFDLKHYLRNVKLEPEIRINGIKFE